MVSRSRSRSRGRRVRRRPNTPTGNVAAMIEHYANMPLSSPLGATGLAAAGRMVQDYVRGRSRSGSPTQRPFDFRPLSEGRGHVRPVPTGTITLSRSARSSGTPRVPAAGRTTRMVARKKLTKSIKTPKRRRVVKVSKSLRNKISTVLDGRYYKGTYQTVTFNSGFNEISNQQKSTRLQQSANTACALWDWNQILDAASILWNNKGGAEGPVIGDTGNFNTLNSHIFIRECHCNIIMRNNSHRTYYVQMHKAVPKSETTNYSDPITQWVDCLSQEGSSGEKINVSNSAVTQTYLRPTQSPSWNRFWKDEVTEYVIEPGQCCSMSIAGPRNFKKEFEKRVLGTNVPLVDKDAVYVWFTHWLDVEPSVSGGQPTGAARWGDSKIADGHGLCWEMTKRFKLSIPENAGFTATATAGVVSNLGGVAVGTGTYNIPLNNRHEAYYYATYGGVGNPGNGGVTAPLRVDPQNPVTDTNT